MTISVKNVDLDCKTKKDLMVVCPICSSKMTLSIPIHVVEHAKQLTTASIPRGMVCEHTFQVFIDKNFTIRGYQKIDCELSKQSKPKNPLKEIYDDFWWLIPRDHPEFQEFILNDARRSSFILTN